MVVQSNRGDRAAARAAGEKCLTLNKYDMLALGEYGGRLLMAGDVTGGMAPLREAGAHGAVRPAWHHIYMFIGSYIGGDMADAVRHANDIPNDNVALGQVARALAAKTAGNPEGMRTAIERLRALGAGWRRDPNAELARLIEDKESSTGWRAIWPPRASPAGPEAGFARLLSRNPIHCFHFVISIR